MLSFVSSAYLNSLSYEQRMRVLYTHVPLGEHPETHDRLMLPDRDRFAGMYVIGKTETGKSSLLENLAAFDAAVDNALFFLDPHGDAVMNIIASLPPQCLPRVSLLDVEDEEYPFGLNLFATGELTTSRALSQAIARIEHLFYVLWPEVLAQQHLPLYLRQAIIALLASPGKTLVDMESFLTDDDIRADILSQVPDPKVREWWHTNYDRLGDKRAGQVRPLTNRLGSLFAGRSLVRNIVGQHHTTIDFRHAIEQKELIFVKLPVNTLEDDARLIGTTMLALLSAAIFSFGDVDPAQRPGVSVYADEFQNFATPDFERLLTQGRKFGARVIIAHQHRSQLTDDKLREATLTVRTTVCFRVSPKGASELAKEFPTQGGDLEPSTRATKELVSRTADFPPVVRAFVETYLRPIPGGGAAIVVQRDPSLLNRLNGTKPDKTKVPNPTAALDGLLYDVMRSGNSALPIPLTAVKGLVNGGIGFYPATLKRRYSYLLTCGIERLPRHFVNVAPEGFRWTRRPEDAKEQLQHCIFHLRMTMAYLAEHPIGKQSAPSSTAVAQKLTRLPNRVAFVHSAEAAGVIVTLDTSRNVTDAELAERLRQIGNQTRARYCSPRGQIEHPEKAPAQTRAPLPDAAYVPQFTRSEEVP
jgi:hypothetical protein